MKDDKFLLLLCLPFGGTSCPPYFCLMSDIIFDTINDLLLCDDWDETKVFSEFSNFVPSDEEMDHLIPFGSEKQITVTILPNDKGSFDIYIEDFIGL